MDWLDMVWALNLALVLLQVGQVTTPVCGSENRDRDIGNGFSLTQYMFDGGPKFSLAYRPTAGSVKTVGLQETSEFRLLFSDMDIADQTGLSGLAGPHVWFSGYRFVRPDGSAIGANHLKLECGGGFVLALTSFNQPEQQCVRELVKDGLFRLTVVDDAETTLSVIIEDRMALGWAVTEAERIWREEIDQARDGRCRLMPSPPPPF